MVPNAHQGDWRKQSPVAEEPRQVDLLPASHTLGVISARQEPRMAPETLLAQQDVCAVTAPIATCVVPPLGK